MKKMLLALVSIAFVATFCIAGEVHSEKELKEDASRHRAMAAAHATAARCIRDKNNTATCLADLKSSCAGLGIGKYCGLKQEAWSDAAKSLRLTAQAHQTVAQCLDAGQPYESCLRGLQTACKGLAVGKFCGMVHSHTN